MKYIVVGGNPFRCYTGTTTYTALKVVGQADGIREAKQIFKEKYEECGGLLIIVDINTGREWVDPDVSK